jgi:cytochrome P450
MTAATAAPAAFLYDPETLATQINPYPAYRRLRDDFPVYRQPDLRFWVLSRFADVHGALADHDTFSSAQGLTWDPRAAEQAGVLPMLVTTDPPAHTDLRKLINRGLTPRRVAALEPTVRRVVTDAIDALRRAGGGDLVDDLAVPLPTAIIGSFLGVPPADRAQFHHWATAVVSGTSGAAYHEEHHRATRDLYGYFGRLIAIRRREPADDLLGALVTAEVDGQRLRDEDALGFCFNLIVGGIETTTSLVTNGMVLLQDHPAVRSRLAAAPHRIPAAIEEFLRLETPVQGLCRTTTRPVERHGVTIPAGEKVLLLFGAGNRDERALRRPRPARPRAPGHRPLQLRHGRALLPRRSAGATHGPRRVQEGTARLGDARIEVERGRRVPKRVNRSWLSLPVRLGPKPAR